MINIIITNVIAIVLILVIIENCRNSATKNMPDKKLFYLMMVMTIIQSITFIVSYQMDLHSNYGLFYLALFVNSLLYLNNIILSFVSTVYFVSKFYSDVKIPKKVLIYVTIPALLIVICLIINLFVPLFFEINKVTLEYTRKPLYFIQVVISILYFLYPIILSLIAKKKGRGHLFFPVIVFVSPIVFAIIIEALFSGVSILMVATAIGLNSIYINLQSKYCSVDQLSGLFTRTHLINDLTESIEKHDYNVCGIMIDIDEFKNINDSYGHICGDLVIEDMGNIILWITKNNKNAVGYRYAGDEFVIIVKKSSDDEINKLLNSLNEYTMMYFKEQVNHCEFTFSYGYSFLDRNVDNLNSFITKIDSQMYINKQNKKMLKNVL